jgi:hypothetical protein
MEHLAIDLGGKESQICVRSSDGQIVCGRLTRHCGRGAAPRGGRLAASVAMAALDDVRNSS